MLALIIAAGMGKRLKDLTEDRPKALLKVAGRELILHALDFTDHPSITERVVVAGYQGDKLETFLQEHAPQVRVLRNARYEEGSILTLACAMPALTQDFLLMNVDHIYPKRMLPLIQQSPEGITACCDFDRTLGGDDMKVKLRADGSLLKISKTLEDYDGGYIGMTRCSASALERYRQGIVETQASHDASIAVESVLAQLAAHETPVNICDLSGMSWLEVDTPDDLAHAEERLRQNPDMML